MNAKTYSASTKARPQQQGFGLIELLVAMLIGLFILLGLTTIFVNMKQAFTSQDQLAQLQDSERLALTMITTTIQSAGYFPDPLVSRPEDALPASTGTPTYGTFVAGQGVVGKSGADATKSDMITVRYVTAPNDGVMDCLGQVNKGTVKASSINTFSISAAGELLCSTDGGTTTTALVSNVASMKILFGTDTANAGNGSADRYLTATQVEAGKYWGNVRTARVTLNLVNPFAAQAGQPATLDWTQIINLMNKK